MQPEADYAVGYKKPPKHSQFPKGQSGNLAGRPRGSKNLRTLIRQVTGEKITVTENGRRRRLSKTELMIRQLINRAALGDPKAIQNVLRLISEFRPPAKPKSRIEAILDQLGNLILSFQEGREPEIANDPGSNRETVDDKPGEKKRSRRSPREPEKVAVMLWRALSEKITITESTRRRRASKFEAMLQFANRASEGDLWATRSMFRLLSQLERSEAEAANKPKPPPRNVVYLPHNYRDPIGPERLALQKEFFELQEQQNRKNALKPRSRRACGFFEAARTVSPLCERS